MRMLLGAWAVVAPFMTRQLLLICAPNARSSLLPTLQHWLPWCWTYVPLGPEHRVFMHSTRLWQGSPHCCPQAVLRVARTGNVFTILRLYCVLHSGLLGDLPSWLHRRRCVSRAVCLRPNSHRVRVVRVSCEALTACSLGSPAVP
jgi:hypothetical protein